MATTPAGQASVEDLNYPAGSLVLLAGLPGAGKSTLLDRLYGLRGDEREPVRDGEAQVIDSRQSRNWWARYLGPIPLGPASRSCTPPMCGGSPARCSAATASSRTPGAPGRTSCTASPGWPAGSAVRST
ncbi:hypothetical protein ACFQX6_02130 [Streptosporangium lutulentum]